MVCSLIKFEISLLGSHVTITRDDSAVLQCYPHYCRDRDVFNARSLRSAAPVEMTGLSNDGLYATVDLTGLSADGFSAPVEMTGLRDDGAVD